MPWLVRFAGSRHRESPRQGATLNGDEAPPCMRWRGLALPRMPRLPIARPPRAAWRSPHRPGKPIARPPQAAWRLPRRPDKPIAQMPCSAWRHRCQIPAVRASLPALAAFPRFPLGRIPSSVVRDFYCQSTEQHKAFRQELQDSLAIHRTSAVYPLSTADFHCAVHSVVHRIWGLPQVLQAVPCQDRHRAAYAPPAVTSSWCVPLSWIRPSAITSTQVFRPQADGPH